MRLLKNQLISSALLGGAALLLASCNFSQMVYPGKDMELPDAACGNAGNAIIIPAEDGTRLQGWFFNRGAATPLVVMYGGNAMNVGTFASLAASDPTRSYLLMNYRGYGNSAGEPSEKQILADARYTIRYARNAMGNPEAPLCLVGFSLGTGVATQLAATENPAGLILVCPFDSMTSVACNIVPFFPRIVPMDSWKSVNYASKVRCPVTILRAKYDQVVPAESTDALIKAFPAPPVVRQFEADHNTIFSAQGFVPAIMQALTNPQQYQFDF
jgi:predicted alpha/beta hydrolase